MEAVVVGDLMSQAYRVPCLARVNDEGRTGGPRSRSTLIAVAGSRVTMDRRGDKGPQLLSHQDDFFRDREVLGHKPDEVYAGGGFHPGIALPVPSPDEETGIPLFVS